MYTYRYVHYFQSDVHRALLKVAVSVRGIFLHWSFSLHQKAQVTSCILWHSGQRMVINLSKHLVSPQETTMSCGSCIQKALANATMEDLAKANRERGEGWTSSISAVQNKYWSLQRFSQTDFLEHTCVCGSSDNTLFFQAFFNLVSCQIHPLQPRNSSFSSITNFGFKEKAFFVLCFCR